jgi:hypothetical protein
VPSCSSEFGGRSAVGHLQLGVQSRGSAPIASRWFPNSKPDFGTSFSGFHTHEASSLGGPECTNISKGPGQGKGQGQSQSQSQRETLSRGWRCSFPFLISFEKVVWWSETHEKIGKGFSKRPMHISETSRGAARMNMFVWRRPGAWRSLF